MVGQKVLNRILDSDWRFKEVVREDDGGAVLSSWMAVASFPSEVHMDLLDHHHIPDPFISFNERDVQCECPACWIY